MRLSASCLLALSLRAAGAFAADDAANFQAVTVKPGDTLWSISQKYLKDPARWDEILKHNRLPSSDPTVALPGMTLQVPIKLIKTELRAAHLIYKLNKVLSRRKATAEWKPSLDNMELFRNDWIRTLEDSKAQVKFLDMDFLQLDSNSMAVINPVDSDYAVELKHGGVFVGKGKIVTASAVITPKSKDTKYEATVRDDLSTLVQVYKGEANVQAEGRTVGVKAGMAAEVKLGAAPGMPTTIPDLPAFEARMGQTEKDLRSNKPLFILPKTAVPLRVGKAPAAAGAADIGQLRVAVTDMQVGQAIAGYRVQCSRSSDFFKPLADKVFEPDEPISIKALNLGSGSYWCRIAAIDLLGSQDKFSAPQRYGSAP